MTAAIIPQVEIMMEIMVESPPLVGMASEILVENLVSVETSPLIVEISHDSAVKCILRVGINLLIATENHLLVVTRSVSLATSQLLVVIVKTSTVTGG